MRQVLGGLLILVAMVTYFKRPSTPQEDQSESVKIAEPLEVPVEAAKTSLPVTGLELPKAANSEIATSFSEAEVPRNRASFRQLIQSVQTQLPSAKALRQLPQSELHHTPNLLREAGRGLGQIAEALHENPHYAEDALAFYKDCFQRKDLPKSVRALCLANHRDFRSRIDERSAGAWTIEERSVPAEVLRLALSLSPIKE